MWSSAGMNIAREHYLTFGDKQIYEEYYPYAKRWLNFLHKHAGESSCGKNNGLLTMYTEHGGLFLGDWARPGDTWESGDGPQAQYFNNCVYVKDLETIIEMANVLGYSEDVERFGKRLQTIKERIHNSFFKPDSKIYADGNQVQMAFALWTGVTPGNLIPEVTANFKSEFQNKPYFDMGSSGLPVLFNYLVDHPENASVTAYHLNQKTQPSYGYFFERGETTWPEYWSVDVESKIHTSYTGVASWFVKSLCGIQPDKENPGYKSFIIRPAIVAEVNFAEASVESPYGTISSRWERNGNQVNLSVTVPPNSKATVYIPSGSVGNVTENGHPVSSVEGITVQGMNGNCVIVSVEPGQYHFISVNYNL
jgi:alpha-L-rhamnosidase